MIKLVFATVAVVFALVAAPAGAAEKMLDAKSINAKIVLLLEDVDTFEGGIKTLTREISSYAEEPKEGNIRKAMRIMDTFHQIKLIFFDRKMKLESLVEAVGGEISPEAAAAVEKFGNLTADFEGVYYPEASASFKLVK